MPEWVSSTLANVGNALRLVVVLYRRVRVRVRVTVHGPLGLDQPHGHQYVIVASNKEREPVGVVKAELEVVAYGRPPAGKWWLVASPYGQVTVPGRHQMEWTLPATDVRALLVNKDLYEARIRGVATLGTGGTKRSGWQRIDRPQPPSSQVPQT